MTVLIWVLVGVAVICSAFLVAGWLEVRDNVGWSLRRRRGCIPRMIGPRWEHYQDEYFEHYLIRLCAFPRWWNWEPFFAVVFKLERDTHRPRWRLRVEWWDG